MICKFPEDMKASSQQVSEIILHLLSTEVRMEAVGL